MAPLEQVQLLPDMFHHHARWVPPTLLPVRHLKFTWKVNSHLMKAAKTAPSTVCEYLDYVLLRLQASEINESSKTPEPGWHQKGKKKTWHLWWSYRESGATSLASAHGRTVLPHSCGARGTSDPQSVRSSGNNWFRSCLVLCRCTLLLRLLLVTCYYYYKVIYLISFTILLWLFWLWLISVLI